MTTNEMDIKFNKNVTLDDTDGEYKSFKSANTQYVFYDDLTQTEKEYVVSHGMDFDLIGRICLNDDLVRKETFYNLIK